MFIVNTYKTGAYLGFWGEKKLNENIELFDINSWFY